VDSIWRKSTKCDSGTCVELALINDDVHVRDAEATVVKVSRTAWSEFVEGVKLGEFDQR
jgi:hypothetical protein